jgi:hypothetical protein
MQLLDSSADAITNVKGPICRDKHLYPRVGVTEGLGAERQ